MLDTVTSGEWKVVFLKEARSRHVVVEVVEPSLGAHNVVEEENLVKDGLGALHGGNVWTRKPREEVPISEVQRVNVGLAQPQNNDVELEE